MNNSFNRFLLIISLVSLLIFSCKSNSSLKNDCDENLNFKELFFYHIENIDKSITISQDVKFRESVIFISNYAPVSVNSIMNYSIDQAVPQNLNFSVFLYQDVYSLRALPFFL